jgi:DNA polymerase (family X)
VDIAIEKVVAKGLETGSYLEINSQPDRLDLRDSHARVAGEAGLPIVISTDSHELGALDFVELGVAQARRAWLTKDQILNTRPWKDVK